MAGLLIQDDCIVCQSWNLLAETDSTRLKCTFENVIDISPPWLRRLAGQSIITSFRLKLLGSITSNWRLRRNVCDVNLQ
jgi:hypothetical protein